MYYYSLLLIPFFHLHCLGPLPELFDIIFKSREREFDKYRWKLLEWAVDLEEGTVKKIRDKKNFQRFAAVIITLMYLVQVNKLIFRLFD